MCWFLKGAARGTAQQMGVLTARRPPSPPHAPAPAPAAVLSLFFVPVLTLSRGATVLECEGCGHLEREEAPGAPPAGPQQMPTLAAPQDAQLREGDRVGRPVPPRPVEEAEPSAPPAPSRSCGGCGADVLPAWAYCPFCGSRQ